jgi:hypothetical protein
VILNFLLLFNDIVHFTISGVYAFLSSQRYFLHKNQIIYSFDKRNRSYIFKIYQNFISTMSLNNSKKLRITKWRRDYRIHFWKSNTVLLVFPLNPLILLCHSGMWRLHCVLWRRHSAIWRCHSVICRCHSVLCWGHIVINIL